MKTSVTIDARELQLLKDAAEERQFLKDYNVYDWYAYDDAMAKLRLERSKKSAIPMFIEELREIIAEATVIQASERGAGYIFEYDEDFIANMFEKYAKIYVNGDNEDEV